LGEVVGGLTFRLAKGLGEAIDRNGLKEKLLDRQGPEATHARLAREILQQACGAWPIARVRAGLRVESELLTPGARQAWERLPQLARAWLTADTETFSLIRSALCDTVRGLLDQETAPSLDADRPAALSARSTLAQATSAADSPGVEATEAEPPVGAGRRRVEPPPEQKSPVARAIAVMWDHRRKHDKLMTLNSLLQLLPDTSRSALYRFPEFTAARAAIKETLRGTVPRGHKTTGGCVEAEDYDPDSEDE
jgi:hypothetical protein